MITFKHQHQQIIFGNVEQTDQHEVPESVSWKSEERNSEG